MTKILPAFLLLVAVVGVLSTGAIAKAPKPPKAQPHPNSTTMTVAANSCTDTPWATDTVKRNVKVHRLTTGATPTYRVKILDKERSSCRE